MIDKTRAREKVEGFIGRRRTYKCTECHQKFQVQTLNPLSEINRVCPKCKRLTNIYNFEDQATGKIIRVRAGDVELATMRAWRIKPNLVFMGVNV